MGLSPTTIINRAKRSFRRLSFGFLVLTATLFGSCLLITQPAYATIPTDSGGGTKTNAVSGSSSGDKAAEPCTKSKCDFVGKYVNPAINLLTALFGIIAVMSLVLGGIQYTTSEGDPQKVAQAKKRIVNTVLAVLAYFALYGFLQFLIPGGLYNR